MNRLTCLLAISLSCLHPLLHGQSSPFYGDWREPAGSVIRIEHCNSGVCMRIVLLSPKVPSTIDTKNPDAAQRRRALCDLVIGSGFQLIDPTHASGGSLYDPKSGNTYRGTMSVEGRCRQATRLRWDSALRQDRNMATRTGDFWFVQIVLAAFSACTPAT